VIKEAFYLFDISLYRGVPSALKGSIYDSGEWFTSKIFADSLATQNNRLLDTFGKKFRPSYDRPAVRWIHLYNTHPPASVDAECRLQRHLRWTPENAKNQASCAVRHFLSVMQEFKKKGIYDNSVILLIADHGAYFSRDLKPPLLGSANPIFLVKPLGARGKLQISDRRVLLTDVPKTVCALTGDCDVSKGLSAFDINNKLRNKRSSIFYDYVWRNGYWSKRHLTMLARYFILGPADNVMSWYKLLLPDDIKTLHLAFNDTDDVDAFGLGWSETRKGQSRFVMGRYAQIYLPLLVRKDAVLEVHIHTIDPKQQQSVKVFIDNQEIGEAPVPSGKEQVLNFKIAAQYVVKPLSRITFEFSSAYDPDPQPEKMKEQLTAVAAAFDELNVRY
jgi:hypothetical protein